MSHRNAPLSETGRLRLARCIVEDGWPLRRAAERFQVSVSTAARWAGRYRELGDAGMADRSSRPHHSPKRTPTRTERRIIKVRVIRRWGPARIGYLLRLHPSTVHRVLTRYGLAKLRWLDRPTGRVIRRMESAACGDLVHVDVKKLGKIPDGGGWRMLGKPIGGRNRQADKSSGQTSKYGNPVRGITSCTPPSMRTHGWPTPNYWQTNAKRRPQRSGCGPTPGSIIAALRCGKC